MLGSVSAAIVLSALLQLEYFQPAYSPLLLLPHYFVPGSPILPFTFYSILLPNMASRELEASIFSTVTLASEFLSRANDIIHTRRNRTVCIHEVSELRVVLKQILLQLEKESPHSSWYMAAQDLVAENGPLTRVGEALRMLLNYTPGERQTEEARSGVEDQHLIWRVEERMQGTVQAKTQVERSFRLTQKLHIIATLIESIACLKVLGEIASELDHM